MMHEKFHHRLLAISLLSLGLGSAYAQAPDRGESAPHERHFDADHLPPQLAALDLSAAQKAQIKMLHESKKSEHQARHEAHRKLRAALRDLSPSNPSYTSEVDRIAQEMGAQKAQQVRDMAAMRASVWAILTPSQQSQLAAMPRPEPRKAGQHQRQ